MHLRVNHNVNLTSSLYIDPKWIQESYSWNNIAATSSVINVTIKIKRSFFTIAGAQGYIFSPQAD
jgi:hypothetical protein